MRPLRVVGIDPSLRNWGLALGTYDLITGRISIDWIDVVNPVISKSKQVRQNSLDLESAEQLSRRTQEVCDGVDAVFVEVPVGSQSARAMASYGICVGVLGALRASGVPFYEVTPTEVKLVASNKEASKADMIAWATATHKEVEWPSYLRNGKTCTSAAKAEHMADAIAAIHAGTKTNIFQQSIRYSRNTIQANNAITPPCESVAIN